MTEAKATTETAQAVKHLVVTRKDTNQVIGEVIPKGVSEEELVAAVQAGEAHLTKAISIPGRVEKTDTPGPGEKGIQVG